MKTINALALRQRFGTVLDEVARTGIPITVTRANKPLVVLVPASGYDASVAGGGRAVRLRKAVERLEEWRRRHEGSLRDLDPVELVRRGRDAR